MFKLFSKHKERGNVPEQIYGRVVARARDPEFFVNYQLADTVMGRFEILALHVFLVSRRMKHEGGDLAMRLGQDVFDLFVEDVDRALRELGIGDTSVPKRKKKMIRSFYGQIEDFDTALDSKDADVLAARANARFYDGNDERAGRLFAIYVTKMSGGLEDQPFSAFKSGEFNWPPFNELESV